MGCASKVSSGDGGAILEDVPHLTDWLPNLPVVVNVHTPGHGVHFRRAGPRDKDFGWEIVKDRFLELFGGFWSYQSLKNSYTGKKFTCQETVTGCSRDVLCGICDFVGVLNF